MKNILILGAGKSATSLINYLLQHAETYNWLVTVGDYHLPTAQQKVGSHKRAKAIFFDVTDTTLCEAEVAKADIVASVLPAKFHIVVAKVCLKFGKHIVTPSYISDQERALDQAFKSANLLFMGEMGLDPGIDHMSMMKMIDHLKKSKANIKAVRSYCGALMANDSDGDNPWKYKFTWAPMNVVLAGKGTARYISNGAIRYIPYNRLFQQIETYDLGEHGIFEAYANRNSVPYRHIYQIPNVPTLLRGTFRKQGYCAAWNALVYLGLTNNTMLIDNCQQLTYAQFMQAFLPESKESGVSVQQQTAKLLGLDVNSDVMNKLSWLGLFSEQTITVDKGTPAQIILPLLAEKWKLAPEDKDMVVMLHKIDFEQGGTSKSIRSSMLIEGKSADETAIALTVGIPMAIMVKLIITNTIELAGVHIPVMPSVYEAVLSELETYGIVFKEEIC